MLIPLNASEAIWTRTAELSGLNYDGSVRPRDEYEFGSSSDFAKAFAAGYHDYASAGIVLGAMNGNGDKSILERAWGRSMTIRNLAIAMSRYWATVAVTPGIPSHGGMRVISVSNNALGLVGAFEAAIRASITQRRSTPFYFNFINNIEKMAVSKIVWIVVELMPSTPPSPVPFPEKIT